MDSPVTVYLAQQLLINPLNPPIGEFGRHLVPWNHTGLPESSAFFTTPHPPLLPFYNAVVIKLFGPHESLLYWSMFPFYLMSVLLCYLFAKKLCLRYALIAALLFALSPMVFVNAQNIMVDIPVTVLMMASLYFMIRDDRRRSALLAGTFAGLACLTKFTAGTLIISAIVLYGSKRQWRSLLLFATPFLICNGAWLLHNQIVFHKMQLISNGHAHYIWGDLRYRLERMVSYLGGTLVLPVFILAIGLFIKRYRVVTIIFIGIALAWSLALRWHLHYSASSCLLYTLFAAAGLLMIAGVIRWLFNIKNNPPLATISIHMILQIAGGLFLTLYATRYALPFAFGCLLWFVLMTEQIKNVRFERIILYAALVSSLIISLLLSISDYQLANAEYRIAQDIRRDYPLSTGFFRGRLGYLYYMAQTGFKDVRVEADEFKPGDLFILNGLYKNGTEFITHHNLTLEKTYTYPLFPLRTIGGRAGFYGNDRLPYAWVRPSNYQFFIYH